MNTIEKKSVKVGKYVSTEHVDNLIRNYKTERWIQNSERMGKEDSICIWWSAEEIAEFLQTAMMHGADGVKMYFGVYGEGASRPEMNGKQTIALVATCNEEGPSGETITRDLYIHRDGKESLLAYNMGGLPANPIPGIIPPSVGMPTLGQVVIADKQGMRVI
jgi:hypothetical protein